jgi:hypothetical protein
MGFTRLNQNTKMKRRMVVSIMGDQKCGKNHFAFGAGGTKAFHSFDYGDEGVIEKFLTKGHIIDKAEYRVDVAEGANQQTVSDACTPAWRAFRVNYALGLAKNDVTIVDTLTEAYEVVRLSYFGKLLQVPPTAYGPVNAEMKDIFRQAYTSGKSLIVLNRMKDEYINKVAASGKEVGMKTGKRVFAGYSQTPYEVQVHLRAYREADGFKMEILDCRQNPDLNGFIMEGDMNNWWTLGTLVFPDSEESEWR